MGSAWLDRSRGAGPHLRVMLSRPFETGRNALKLPRPMQHGDKWRTQEKNAQSLAVRCRVVQPANILYVPVGAGISTAEAQVRHPYGHPAAQGYSPIPPGCNGPIVGSHMPSYPQACFITVGFVLCAQARYRAPQEECNDGVGMVGKG